MKMIPRYNILFLILLFFKLFLIFKSSGNFDFINPSLDRIFYITDIQSFQFVGTIEIISGSFHIYCFSSSNVQKDEYGNYNNYVSYFEYTKGEKRDIKSNEKYIIFIGMGHISFNSNKYTQINLNNILNVKLPYELNNKFYKLNGKGNKLEVSISNPSIDVIISNNSNICNNVCQFDVSSDVIINIRNIKYAQNGIVKLLYVQRNTSYIINEDYGDNIQYIIK